jgi:hypothetical protein
MCADRAERTVYSRRMGIDLSDRQRADHRDQGKITGADGRGYIRRGSKTRRSVADDLVASGVPIVLDMYSSGQFEWFDGDAATAKWATSGPTSSRLSQQASSWASARCGTLGSGRTRTAADSFI